MKKIQYTNCYKDKSIFSINNFYFYEAETKQPPVPLFHMRILNHFDSELDIHLWIDELHENICFLLESPVELTELIKKYESDNPFRETCLFHDLRTNYIDIINLQNDNIEDNIIFVGYSIQEEYTCFSIKAFSFQGLFDFWSLVNKYCENNEIEIEYKENIKWMQFEKCLLKDTNFSRTDFHSQFLEKTLEHEYSNFFLQAFREIDNNGFLHDSFFDKEVIINNHRTKLRQINQFTKYFSAYWKTEIPTKETSRSVICLYDEILNDENRQKVVYTMKPYLMQYYQLHWFEDFCSSLLKKINTKHFKIEHILTNREFNFFEDPETGQRREIDILLGVSNDKKYRTIAIECKKTISHSEIKKTNDKIKNRIFKAGFNAIDAYIHIGFNNNDVVFDKTINNSSIEYKLDLLQCQESEQVDDAPYYAIAIKSREDFESKLKFIISDIFEQW
ncbi:hypothetical protein [[Clostridium] polysaccharolyticum]|uniref:Uncharacterized protein n=1 Tax=[Clostridium] polysaccharolyticum TaxID=29364 RepID=A0A1I0F9M8_9FIRM|nr:hypothetical protein [[Clostridium] polysaccharolyticum]SET54813.1 hypothetical protein SAMN04487772_1297 [[Clostridium] polysaccharolyticum]